MSGTGVIEDVVENTAPERPYQARKRARSQRADPAAERPKTRPAGQRSSTTSRQSCPRRQRIVASAPIEEASKSTPTEVPPVKLTNWQVLHDLACRANDGDEHSLRKLCEVIAKNPAIWRAIGDASKLAERCWISLMANGDLLVEESIPRQLSELKATLSGPMPTAMEKMLIDMLGIRWLAVQHAERAAADTGGDVRLGMFRLKRAESAQKRFASTLKMLLLVRSLQGLELPLDAGPESMEGDAT